MSADARLIVWAIVVQVGLTLVLTFWMAIVRGLDFKAGLDPQSIALREPLHSPRAVKISNAFANQFELPVLFYIVAILFLVAVRADLVAAILAWVFVILRLVHALVHTTSNIVRIRGPVFGLGALTLLILWIYFIVSFAGA